MSTQTVSEIYDTLFEVESNLNSATYPIHKKLNFGEKSELKDVYEWLFQHIEFPQKGKILDAGCGVGFGSFFFSQNTDCQITGISLSEKEVELANSIAQKRGLENRVNFKVQSFDNPIGEKYDLIIAVESIKHTLNLKKALQNLNESLKIGGSIVIVEDFYQEGKNNKYANVMAEDWSLVKVFSKSDYLNSFQTGFEINSHDLTHFTLKKNVFQLKVRYHLLGLLTFIGKIFGKGNFWKIMRGGLALDILFAQKQMTYEVLEIKKTA